MEYTKGEKMFEKKLKGRKRNPNNKTIHSRIFIEFFSPFQRRKNDNRRTGCIVNHVGVYLLLGLEFHNNFFEEWNKIWFIANKYSWTWIVLKNTEKNGAIKGHRRSFGRYDQIKIMATSYQLESIFFT